jgi:hypothetical protein
MFKKLFSIQVFVLFMMLFIYSISFAQTLTTDAPVQQKALELFLKVLFPAIWTGVAPWLTGLVSKSLLAIPPQFKIVVSSVLGAVFAGSAGLIPDFPLTPESAATMGLAGGATGQTLLNMQPPVDKPKS